MPFSSQRGQSQSKESITKIMSILGAFAACVIAIVGPGVYYAISINTAQKALTTEAAFLAKSIEKNIQASPDLWEFESVGLKHFVSLPSIHGIDHELEIRNTAGKLVEKTDLTVSRPIISTSATFFDSGRLAGSIVVRHSIRTQIITTALMGILSSLFGFLLYFIFRTYPIRKLESTLIDLQRARDELEQRVADRTEELMRVNEELRAEITERKRAEEALQEGQRQQKAILDNIPDIAWLKDKESRFIAVNEPFGKSCGFEPEDLVGKTDLYIWPRDLAERYRADDKEVMESGKRKQVEEPLTDSEGKSLWIETIKTPIYDEQGNVAGTAGIARDITERKRAEEERKVLQERLNRAEKMEALGTLAGGVAHDLNNVLGVVIGYAELVLMNADESSPIRPQLVDIMNGGLRAAAIVDDLLTLARRGVSNRDVLNMNKIVSDCQKSPEFEKLYSYHPSVEFKTDLEPDLPNISGSSVHLVKSLYNLISNASEAMTKGGVTIKTTNQYLDKPIQGYDKIREGDYVVLSVSDTGEGISADNLKRIFEPFYTKKVMGRSGTGLGLAVVWGTVKDHHGYINVESEEGKGSTFTLYFPVTREGITAEAVAIAISEYMGKGESILVVDDVKEQRDLAADMLRTLNYNVSSVSSGEEAIAYMKDHRADLMVLDMIMDPGMDGRDTYRSILEIHSKQRAIIVSGFSETDRVKAAKGLGVGAYLRKPYIKEKLGLAVRKELDRK